MESQNPLEIAKARLGVGRLARVCKVSREAARKWFVQGHLPRTEWTGETNYARLIAEAYIHFCAADPRLDDPPLTAQDLQQQLLAIKPPVRAATDGSAGLAAAATA